MSKISSLQLLRGVAASLVVGFHLHEAALHEGGEPGLFRLFAGGEIGVDIFFVISGFVIFYVAQNRPGQTRGDFLRARFWRILPPYWVITLLFVLAALAQAALLGDASRVPSLESLLISVFLLPYPDHVIIIAWTLSVELLFYGVFALTFFGGGTRRLIAAMALWVIASQIAAQFGAALPLWLRLPLHSAVLEFLFGILIAMAFLRRGGRMPFALPALSLGVIGVAAYSLIGGYEIGPFGREIAAGVPSAFLVYGAVGLTFGQARVVQTWGESSYILYLFHLLYFSVAGQAIEIALGVNVYQSQIGLLALFFSVIVVSYAATVCIERPYQRWYRRFLRTRPQAAA